MIISTSECLRRAHRDNLNTPDKQFFQFQIPSLYPLQTGTDAEREGAQADAVATARRHAGTSHRTGSKYRKYFSSVLVGQRERAAALPQERPARERFQHPGSGYSRRCCSIGF